ncbi:MAG: hypothetical protein RLZZ399_2723 [Verrucomicrobiota bacterium]|jgi:hypothetical protein
MFSEVAVNRRAWDASGFMGGNRGLKSNTLDWVNTAIWQRTLETIADFYRGKSIGQRVLLQR